MRQLRNIAAGRNTCRWPTDLRRLAAAECIQPSATATEKMDIRLESRRANARNSLFPTTTGTSIESADDQVTWRHMNPGMSRRNLNADVCVCMCVKKRSKTAKTQATQ
ncbi:hypothetical protein M513_03311 [Trichuris suis]|uniref:Uncharacterized protein n=1 Tax=Trichuris suis TaxID=68888 RepID=A0A085MF76_9BILA|nr:hypothetical protein M513_03311 [Trichuris suis]